jgi:hypothetical protein
MKYKLIPTEKYILVVDDSEIKEGDFIYDLDIKRIVIADDLKVATSKASLCWYYKKIISHTPLNGAPYIDGLDVLPPNWRDSGEEESKLDFAKMFYNLLKNTYPTFEEWPEAVEYRNQSLQQPKLPIGFECETERVENNDVVFEDGSFNKWPYRYVPKTIINAGGRKEWVGKYIYE